LAGRTFYDDDDLAAECAAWLHRANMERPSDATEQLPAALLAEERRHFTALPAVAADYGLFDSVLVSRESLVTIATNRYSVPAALVGQPLTARLHQSRIELFRGAEQVAVHTRHYGRHQRIVIPEHFDHGRVCQRGSLPYPRSRWKLCRGHHLAAPDRQVDSDQPVSPVTRCCRRPHQQDGAGGGTEERETGLEPATACLEGRGGSFLFVRRRLCSVGPSGECGED
jgi:hypothetical protein